MSLENAKVEDLNLLVSNIKLQLQTNLKSRNIILNWIHVLKKTQFSSLFNLLSNTDLLLCSPRQVHLKTN